MRPSEHGLTVEDFFASADGVKQRLASRGSRAPNSGRRLWLQAGWAGGRGVLLGRLRRRRGAPWTPAPLPAGGFADPLGG